MGLFTEQCKSRLKETIDVGKDILKDIGSEKTSLMLAQQYITDHKDEARQSYLEIFKAIADEFKERRFVLIFDQFENVGKASTDFFLNFVKFLEHQERFDIIVSFRTDDTTTWNDSAARKVYEDLERKMTYDLGAKKISIEGLSAEDIGSYKEFYQSQIILGLFLLHQVSCLYIFPCHNY